MRSTPSLEVKQSVFKMHGQTSVSVEIPSTTAVRLRRRELARVIMNGLQLAAEAYLKLGFHDSWMT